jgi:hypothetical protein
MEFLLKVVEDNVINEYEFIDIITQLSNKKISILINEGPDLNKIKVFGKSFIECLQIITKNLKIEKNNITLITYNLVQDLSIWPNIKIIHPVEYFSSAKNFNIIINKNILKHFGIFVGGSRWHRLYIASNIFANHKDKLLISYWQHHFNKEQPANLYIDNILMKLHNVVDNKKIYDNIFNFVKALPLHLKEQDIKDNKNTGYINWDKGYEILPYYNHIFVDIVCETWHNGQCFLPNEKSGRPIISKTPFIIYSSKHFLKNLKKLGFQTFDRWWSESYDEFEGVKRIQKILIIVDQLSKKTINELNKMYLEMTDVLEYNYKILISLDNKKILEKMK